jgi:hypothetical protein
VRIALAAGVDALAGSSIEGSSIEGSSIAGSSIAPEDWATVFASADGDGDILQRLCQSLAAPQPSVSPTRFHNSVHNAPSGYWSIATRCMAPSTSLCGYDASFGAGLLEACAFVRAHGKPVLLIAYDAPYPEPLLAKRPVRDAFGVALLLAPQAGAGALARLELSLDEGAPDRLADPGLEALRRAVPTARSLPLLRLLARRESGAALIEYLGGPQLALKVAPCA